MVGEEDRYEITFTRAERGSDPERARLAYRFRGKVVFHKGAFRNGDDADIPLKLPLAPDLIYGLGVDDGGINHCTDHHYNTEGDYWYFWDPEMKGCPKETRDAVHRPVGKLTRIANTRLTYPNYDELYGDNFNGDKFEIFVFLGYYKDIHQYSRPPRRDLAVPVFRDFERQLKARGFSKTEEDSEFRLRSNGTRMAGINYYRVYESGKVVVRMLLADTALGSGDGTFHHYFRQAARSSDVVVYDGHSGLGSNLDLREIGDIRFNKDKYQIFFINGCSTYPYFNGSFFERKGGRGNLELILSGLPTLSDTSGSNLMAFLEGFLDQKPLSYQRILQVLERSNADSGTYLFGVVGDEDNRWKP